MHHHRRLALLHRITNPHRIQSAIVYSPGHALTLRHRTHAMSWNNSSSSSSSNRKKNDINEQQAQPFRAPSRPFPQRLTEDRRKSNAVARQIRSKKVAAAIASGSGSRAKKRKKMPPSERKQLFAITMQQLRQCFRSAHEEGANTISALKKERLPRGRKERERIGDGDDGGHIERQKRHYQHSVDSNSTIAWNIFQEKIIPQKLHIPLDDYYRFFEILAKEGLVNKCFRLYSHMKKFDHVKPDRNIHALLIHACAQGREDSDSSGANAKYVQRARQVLERACQEYEAVRKELLKLDAERVQEFENEDDGDDVASNEKYESENTSASPLPSNLRFFGGGSGGEDMHDEYQDDNDGVGVEFEDIDDEFNADSMEQAEYDELDDVGQKQERLERKKEQNRAELTFKMRGRLSSVRPTTYMLNEFLRTCLNAKDLHSALHAYDFYVRSHFVPDAVLQKEHVFDKEEDDDDDVGLNIVGKDGKTKQLKSSVYFRPDKITFSIMIQMMAASGNSEACFSVLDDLRYFNRSVMNAEHQIRPDAFFYNNLLKACMLDIKRNNESGIELMFSIYRQMVQVDQIRPTIHTFNLLLQAASSISTNVRKIEKLYRAVERDTSEDVDDDTMSQSQTSADEKEQQLLRSSLVYRIYREMQAQHVQADQFLLNYFAQLLAKEGLCHLAVKDIIQGQLASRFMSITKDTFSVVIKELFRHRIALWKSGDYLEDRAFVFDPALGTTHQMTTVDENGKTIVKQLSKKQIAARTLFQYYVRPVLQLMLQRGEAVDIDLMESIVNILLRFTTSSYGKSNMKFDIELIFCFVDYCHSRFQQGAEHGGRDTNFHFPQELYHRLRNSYAASKSDATRIRVNAMQAFVTKRSDFDHIGKDAAISLIQSPRTAEYRRQAPRDDYSTRGQAHQGKSQRQYAQRGGVRNAKIKNSFKSATDPKRVGKDTAIALIQPQRTTERRRLAPRDHSIHGQTSYQRKSQHQYSQKQGDNIVHNPKRRIENRSWDKRREYNGQQSMGRGRSKHRESLDPQQWKG